MGHAVCIFFLEAVPPNLPAPIQSVWPTVVRLAAQTHRRWYQNRLVADLAAEKPSLPPAKGPIVPVPAAQMETVSSLQFVTAFPTFGKLAPVSFRPSPETPVPAAPTAFPAGYREGTCPDILPGCLQGPAPSCRHLRSAGCSLSSSHRKSALEPRTHPDSEKAHGAQC